MKTQNRKAAISAGRAAKSKGGSKEADATPIPAGKPVGGGRIYLTSAKAYYLTIILIAAISLWMRKGFPVYLLPNAGFDDGLFIRAAQYLKAGDWLGPYDKLTLSKGMFYPLFVCAASLLAIPLKIAEQAVYLAASALTAGLVRRRVGRNHLPLILFGLLAFNPVLWHNQLARVIREGLYISLSLALVALSVIIAFPTQEKDRYGSRILCGIGLGIVAGAYWLTREEGIWLLPTLAVVLTVALIGVLLPDWVPASERALFARRSDHLKAIAMPFVIALAVFLAVDGLVAGLNYKYYGIFETNEFRAKSFLRAYGALSRIQHDQWRTYIPFPKDARQRAYSVSPAARELAPFLDGGLAEGWRSIGCRTMEDDKKDVTPCDEVLAGWSMWELRDAVDLAGHYSSAVKAMAFYDRLAKEIDTACADGRISCLPPRTTMQPPFRREYLGAAVRSGLATTNVLFTMGDGVVGSAPSTGSSQEISALSDIVTGVYPPSTTVIQARIASASRPRAIQPYMPAHRAAPHASITVLPSQDVAAANPGLETVRFRLETDCPIEDCVLVVAEAKGQIQIPMPQLVPGARLQGAGGIIAVETVSVSDATKSAEGTLLKIASLIASGYAVGFPVLAGLSAAGLFFAVWFQKQYPITPSLLALGLGSLAAVATRIALLAYIDATSFPAANLLYMSPGSPFVIIFTVVGIYSGCCVALRGTRWLLPAAKLSSLPV